MSMNKDNSGCTLRQTLSLSEGQIMSIAWSPDGKILASSSNNGTVHLWNIQLGKSDQTLSLSEGQITSIAWSPDGKILATISNNSTIELCDIKSRKVHYTLWSHLSLVGRAAWSPDGKILASGARDGIIWLLNTESDQLSHISSKHPGPVMSIAWSPDGKTLASGTSDSIIQLLDIQARQQTHALEGITGRIKSLAFSADGHLFASYSPSESNTSYDAAVHIWRTDTWERVAVLNCHTDYSFIAFHPKEAVLAMIGKKNKEVLIWDLDLTILLGAFPATDTVHYMNAKVVLVGDSGVGKSGLGLVLCGKSFVPTESTHGRHVWTFFLNEVNLDGMRKETREILLWDLAGQPGYRIIHQLHLDEIAVALVVFDAKSETDPFAGVQYWNRALQHAHSVQGNMAPPLTKFLVAARTDRAGIGVSADRIRLLVQELGFEDYFETSAKQGHQITNLKASIEKAIDWGRLPKISSTRLFQNIKVFLITEKGAGQLLSTTDDLYRMFLRSKNVSEKREDLRAQFETCIRQMESSDLIKRLSFGNLVLLQPELLDAYASALVNAVKDEPDGLGSISEEGVRAGDFRIPEDERLTDKAQEKLLLIAMIEDLLGRELILREDSFLIFPSQSTRENPNPADLANQSVIFTFEGPVQNIYATLAVRLAQSDLFKKKEIWKNAVTYTTKMGGIYGIYLSNKGEGSAELTLFFDTKTNEQTRFYFEEYVYAHLQRRALLNSIQRLCIRVCDKCGWVATDQTIQSRLNRGFNWLNCPICDNHLSLVDSEEILTATSSSRIREMDHAADRQRDREVAKLTIQGKKESNDFDVFLCHNSKDKPAVKRLAERLKEQGLLPWLDEWELRPGLPWQRLLEYQIEQIKAAAVFVGTEGIGPWQEQEIDAFLREFIRRGCPVIPILLPDVPKVPQLPVFLRGMTWVDFRIQDPDPLKRLIWGITGEREGI